MKIKIYSYIFLQNLRFWNITSSVFNWKMECPKRIKINYGNNTITIPRALQTNYNRKNSQVWLFLKYRHSLGTYIKY